MKLHHLCPATFAMIVAHTHQLNGWRQFICPKGNLSETYRQRVTVRVSVKFGNLHNSFSDK